MIFFWNSKNVRGLAAAAGCCWWWPSLLLSIIMRAGITEMTDMDASRDMTYMTQVNRSFEAEGLTTEIIH